MGAGGGRKVELDEMIMVWGVYSGTGVFKVLGVGWELPPKFSRIFYLGRGNSPCPILFLGSVWYAIKYSF